MEQAMSNHGLSLQRREARPSESRRGGAKLDDERFQRREARAMIRGEANRCLTTIALSEERSAADERVEERRSEARRRAFSELRRG